eukprot:Lithocolla_globosa_v1_NODE_4524_length_1417_cov_15.572687.p2 type:complete len:153 gc:universal NODE_4524_length_1417_cov_15.572687:648-1106(+)
MSAAICNSSSFPQTWSSCPARTRPAITPETMAAELDPKPRAKGMRLIRVYLRAGTGFCAFSKAFCKPTQTRLVASRGSSSSPSPVISKENDSATSTVSSFQMSSAIPIESNPGPMLAVVAGTCTVTDLAWLASPIVKVPWRALISRRILCLG